MNTRHWPHIVQQSPRSKPKEIQRHEVCDFQVIGELKDDPHQLLLMGDDGRCYAYHLTTGEIANREPDDSWSVDMSLPTSSRNPALPPRN